jgi:hypothetical protein
MKIATPESPKPVDHRTILLLGPPGSRKTTLCLQIPQIAIFDVDGNMDGPLLALKKLGCIPSYGYEQINRNGSGGILPVHQQFDNLIKQMKDLRDSVDHGFKFACIDGLRNIGELIKAKIFEKQRKDSMDTRDWDPYKTDMAKLVFHEARNLGMHVLFTCHERAVYKQSGNSKEMMKEVLEKYEPLLQGGIQDAFGGFFTDVWRITTEAGGAGTVNTRISVLKDTYSPDLKSSVGIPDEGITIKSTELAWPKLEPYFKDLL